jgi:hypothetical protein
LWGGLARQVPVMGPPGAYVLRRRHFDVGSGLGGPPESHWQGPRTRRTGRYPCRRGLMATMEFRLQDLPLVVLVAAPYCYGDRDHRRVLIPEGRHDGLLSMWGWDPLLLEHRWSRDSCVEHGSLCRREAIVRQHRISAPRNREVVPSRPRRFVHQNAAKMRERSSQVGQNPKPRFVAVPPIDQFGIF